MKLICDKCKQEVRFIIPINSLGKNKHKKQDLCKRCFREVVSRAVKQRGKDKR